jgi:parallel beta-helix repeat protein
MRIWEGLMNRFVLAAAAALAISGCGRQGAQPETPAAGDAAFAEKLRTALLDAKPGDVIEIPEGVHKFDRSLSLAVDGVTIRGAGMDKSILSFKGQIAGAEGVLVTASDFTIEDLAIEDAKGDGLKINEGKNIIIRRVRAEWTGEPKTENGAYGVYPVQTRNVLIDGVVAIGASDAGIYVGQSENVIVRNSRAERNVAGIEIENTIGADVYDNVATDNTGGILVFNMPNLKTAGARTRVFRNRIAENNRKNFGHPGTPVAAVPAGSGVVINSNDEVEIFDNDIAGNRTANVIVASIYASGVSQDGMTETFDPYPEGIFIHSNRFADGGKNPDRVELQALRLAMFGPTGALPDILWDGFVDAEKFVSGVLPDALRLCVDNGAAATLSIDAPNNSKSPAIVSDAVRCRHQSLPAIALEGGLGE